MLLWARYQDGEIAVGKKSIHLKRGQFLTTLNVLAGHMRCSKQTVLTFLRVLESSQMIKREKQAKFTIITIVNYDKYQPSGMTEKRSSNEAENEPIFDHSLDRRLDPIKEINNKEKISSSSSREKILNFFKEIRESEDFWEATANSLSVPIDSLKAYAEDFFGECLAKGDFPESQQEVRKHLFNWLRKRFEIQKSVDSKKRSSEKRTVDKKKTDGTTETDNRRGFDAPAPSTEKLSKGIF